MPLGLLLPHTKTTHGTIVNTTSGPVKGHPSTLQPEVSEYLGIRFAQPPVGDLRFAPPQPVEASSSIINVNSWVFPVIQSKQNTKKKFANTFPRRRMSSNIDRKDHISNKRTATAPAILFQPSKPILQGPQVSLLQRLWDRLETS